MQLVSKTGVLLDNRSDYEKSRDYKHEEIAMGFSPYVWEERAAKSRYFYAYNQYTSLSCVAGGGAIVLEFFDKAVVSRKDIYNPRGNYPNGGMTMYDVNSAMRRGVALEVLVPSQNLGENKMNERYAITTDIIKSRAKHRVAQTFTVEAFNDIDTIASIVKSCPVICFWYFDEAGNEWWKQVPSIMKNFNSYVAAGVTRHQVCIVDAILIDGKKHLVGQDTAGIGTGAGDDANLRYISEEMVSKRLYAASYAIDDEDEIIKPDPIAQPKYKNLKHLNVGARGDEVTQLQNVLIFEGLLKIKAPTGYFGGLTMAAVIKLQEKYKDEILKPANLKKGTGYMGELTNQFLNKKYK